MLLIIKRAKNSRKRRTASSHRENISSSLIFTSWQSGFQQTVKSYLSTTNAEETIGLLHLSHDTHNGVNTKSMHNNCRIKQFTVPLQTEPAADALRST